MRGNARVHAFLIRGEAMKTLISSVTTFLLLLFTTAAECQINYGSNEQVGKYADVNGIKVYYEIYGAGEPLLLLHGNGGSIENFLYQIPELSKHFKVIAVDSREQGKSTDSDKERLDRLSPAVRKKLSDLMEKYPNLTVEQLKQIKVPVLVVVGDRDAINLEQTISLFRNLPHSQLLIVPGASHMAPIEQPELLNSEVIKFLSTPYRDLDRYYFMSFV